jgi:hypothetical protein
MIRPFEGQVRHEDRMLNVLLVDHSQSVGMVQEPVRVALRHEAKEGVQLRGHRPERTRGVFSAIRRGLSQAEHEAWVKGASRRAQGWAGEKITYFSIMCRSRREYLDRLLRRIRGSDGWWDRLLRRRVKPHSSVAACLRNLFRSCLRQTELRTVLAIVSDDRSDGAMHPSQVALAPPSLLERGEVRRDGSGADSR